MISVSGTVQALLDAPKKTKITWLFNIREVGGTEHHVSTRTVPAGEVVGDDVSLAAGLSLDTPVSLYVNTYAFKVANFSGITLQRVKEESGLASPSYVQFDLLNGDSAFSAASLKGASVWIDLCWGLDGEDRIHVVRRWRFRVIAASPVYNKIRIRAEDFFQEYLEGYWPNTPLAQEVFPMSLPDAGACVPVTFGNPYIPLEPVKNPVSSNVLYLLGTASEWNAPLVETVRSPRKWGSKSVWTIANTDVETPTIDSVQYYLVGPHVVASGGVGTTPDSVPYFPAGEGLLPVPIKVTDVARTTNTFSDNRPAYLVFQFLQEIGVPLDDIDAASVAEAQVNLDALGLYTVDGGWWVRVSRQEALATLLTQFGLSLTIEEKVRVRCWNKASQKTITSALVVGSETKEGTFKYAENQQKRVTTGGYVAVASVDEPIDGLYKVVVAPGGTGNIGTQVIDMPFIADSDIGQQIGFVAFQKKILKKATASFQGKPSLLALEPNDVVAVDCTSVDYGPVATSYPVIIETISITESLAVKFTCGHYYDTDPTVGVSDFIDIVPTAVTLDDVTASTGSWQPVYGGSATAGGSTDMPTALPGALWVGQTSTHIKIDPSRSDGDSATGPAVETVIDGVSKVIMGFLDGWLATWPAATGAYGFAIKDSSGTAAAFSAAETPSGFAVQMAGWEVDASEFKYTAGGVGNEMHFKPGTGIWLGAAALGSAPFSVTAAGALVASNATITGSITAATGSIGGWAIGATTLSSGNVVLDSANDKIVIGSAASTVAMENGVGFWAGNAVFGSAPFSVSTAGAMTATSGAIAGWAIAATTLSSGNVVIDSANDKIVIGSAAATVAMENGVGFWAGDASFAAAPFSVSTAGALTAISGSIGGWTIGTSTLTGGSVELNATTGTLHCTTAGITAQGALSTSIRIWAGTTYLNRDSANFRVRQDGYVTAVWGMIGGWGINGNTLYSTPGGITLDGAVPQIKVGSTTPYINIQGDGSGASIGTSTFASGTTGWRISHDGSAEFNNIVCRGTFRASVFTADEMHATGGTNIVLRAGKTLGSVNLASASYIDVESGVVTGQLFVVDDIIRLKHWNGSSMLDKWFKVTVVTPITGGHRYNVTHEWGSGTGTVPAGAAAVGYGQISGSGYVLSTSDMTNGPYVSIATHSGSPWLVTTERVRVGNLAGITSPHFGTLSGYGFWTDLGYLEGSFYAAGDVTIGDYGGGNAGIFWDQSAGTLQIRGSVIITSGSIEWADVLDGAGTRPDNNATVGAIWGTNLGSIPTRFGDAPSGDGLYLTASYMGYYASAAWKTHLTNTGWFYLGGSSGALVYEGDGANAGDLTVGNYAGNAGFFWDQSAGTFTIKGDLNVYGGGIFSSLLVNSGGNIRQGQTAFDTGTGFWLGDDSGTPKFSIGNSAANKVTWDGTTLTIVGTLTGSDFVSSGTLTGNITTSGDNAGMSGEGATAGSIRFWAGDTYANRATAPFRVQQDGTVISTSTTLTGGAVAGFTVAATTLTGTNLVLDSANDKIVAGSAATTIALQAGTGLWAGDATFASAPFRVTPAGALTAYGATIKGTLRYGTSTDTFLTSVGQYLNTLTSTDPPDSEFTSNGKLQTYYWGGSTWELTGTIGNGAAFSTSTTNTDAVTGTATGSFSAGVVGNASGSNAYGGDFYSANFVGLRGVGVNSAGVFGTSTNSSGVSGNSTNAYGVVAGSTNSYGVHATGGSAGGYFTGATAGIELAYGGSAVDTSIYMKSAQSSLIDGSFGPRMVNKLGKGSIKGQVVRVYATLDEAVESVAVDGTNALGVLTEYGVADGSTVGLATSGLAFVAFDTATTSVARDDVVRVSSTDAGKAKVGGTGQYLGRVVGSTFNVTSSTAWSASATFAVGDYMKPSGGYQTDFYYRCSTAGNTGTTEPTWTSYNEGDTITESGGVVWTVYTRKAKCLLNIAHE